VPEVFLLPNKLNRLSHTKYVNFERGEKKPSAPRKLFRRLLLPLKIQFLHLGLSESSECTHNTFRINHVPKPSFVICVRVDKRQKQLFKSNKIDLFLKNQIQERVLKLLTKLEIYVINRMGEIRLQDSDSNVTTYSPRALLSLSMLAIFAYFQHLATDNRHFLLLTFSSYIFLAIGAALLFSAAAEPQPRRRRIFVNSTVSIFIIVTLIAAYSLATIPRGGIKHNYHVSPNNFTITLKSHGEPGHYSGGNYPLEPLFIANYPVGYAAAFSSWDFSLKISFDKPVSLNGTLYAAFVFTSNPGSFRERVSRSITFADETSAWVDIDALNFWGWGSSAPNNHRVRVEGYRFEVWVSLWVDGEDYGPKLNCTVQPYREVYVYDYVVDSQLQNTAAILLCGVFAGILCYIPAKSIKPKIDAKFAPIIGGLETFLSELWSKQRETPKVFLKKCGECAREIPIASEECPYCKAKQKG